MSPSAQYTEFVENKYDGGHNQEEAEDEAQCELGNHPHKTRADDRAGNRAHGDGNARRVIDVSQQSLLDDAGMARIITAISDVPDAWRISMPIRDSMRGTMMNPPPTPT